jgi:hypothetical protein
MLSPVPQRLPIPELRIPELPKKSVIRTEAGLEPGPPVWPEQLFAGLPK